MTKICKECGKPFEPDNPHQKYCKRDHYRPCPICGNDVKIKYLSDPTPRCECCRGKRKLDVTKGYNSSQSSGAAVVRRYTGKDRSRWEVDHSYAIKIRKEKYGYVILANKDMTTGEDVNLYMMLSHLDDVNDVFVIVDK